MMSASWKVKAKILQFQRAGRMLRGCRGRGGVPDRARLFGIQYRVKVSREFRAGPILRTNDFAVETAFPIDNIGFWIHRSAVVERNFLRWIAIVGKTELVGLQKIVVGGLVLVEADAQDCATARSNPALQGIKRRCLVHARRAPGGPEIEQDNLATKIAQARRFSVDGKREVLFWLAAEAWLALTIICPRKHVEKARDEDQDQSGV